MMVANACRLDTVADYSRAAHTQVTITHARQDTDKSADEDEKCRQK